RSAGRVVHRRDDGGRRVSRQPAASERGMSVNRAFVLAVALACCAGDGTRYSRKQAQHTLAKLEAPGTTIGEFQVTSVVDGDTIHVDGLDSSLRLLGIDTEETFKSEA